MTAPAATPANLISDIDDLIKQATTENSHYYTASVLRRSRDALAEKDRVIERLSGALRPFETMFEAISDEDKAMPGVDAMRIEDVCFKHEQATVGHLRHASEALASLNQASDRTEK